MSQSKPVKRDVKCKICGKKFRSHHGLVRLCGVACRLKSNRKYNIWYSRTHGKERKKQNARYYLKLRLLRAELRVKKDRELIRKIKIAIRKAPKIT